ncbi:hypothetical protein HNP52_003380 [Sphingomonas kyeonggiensis]|uniref:Uncharacterized protein n=1 Tax=Sphingomonas kyeonggiensis TaxID=1268553 RepID=A0A7W7NST4_9SPHN|nr:hypothetical protein [Sphingomonas kyeonggiensis]MBB4840288.1 hypothetical protein [Sphingomonas kyeonggiensis]
MVLADPKLEVSQFIDSAKNAMGTLDDEKGLAYAFASQAGLFVPELEYPNFWQVGCVFDTVLDYFLALKEAGELDLDSATLMEALVNKAVHGYQYGIVGLTAAWYDDWSWWGIAASKAFDPEYSGIFGDKLEFFQTAAIDLWGLVDDGDFTTIANRIPDAIWANSALQSNRVKFTREILSARGELHIGTRNSWALIERGAQDGGTPRQNADYATFTTQTVGDWAVPRFPGGCWQYDFSTLPFPVDDGPDASNPNPAYNTLGVFQVTLMSGLYLSFCCSLIAAANRKAAEGLSGGAWDRLQSVEAYRQKADEVAAFLASWLNLPGSDSLATEFAHGKLVHERTPTYAPFDAGGLPPVEGYFANAYWGGDQGLIMGALAQYAQLPGANVPDADSYPSELLQGVFYNMPAFSWGHPNMVGPYLDPQGNSPISRDSNDYGSGSGIFWRYVMRTCRADPSFGNPARQDPYIVSTATNSGTIDNDWGNNLFQPFNTVAAAIGAWYLLK